MLHSVKEALVFNLKTLTHSGLEVHPEGNFSAIYRSMHRLWQTEKILMQEEKMLDNGELRWE
jgi:hypothetical protein